jgi:hypothetical protein
VGDEQINVDLKKKPPGLKNVKMNQKNYIVYFGDESWGVRW